MPNGTVKTSFAELDSDDDIGSTSYVFPSLMITLASTRNNPEKDIPVHSFYPDGSIAYVDKINGHFIWDVDSSRCDPDCDCDLDDDDDCCHHRSRCSRRSKKKAPLPIDKKALEFIH